MAATAAVFNACGFLLEGEKLMIVGFIQ